MKVFAQTPELMKEMFCNYFGNVLPKLGYEPSMPILIEGDIMPYWIWIISEGWTLVCKKEKMMLIPQVVKFTLCLSETTSSYRVYEARYDKKTAIILELLPPISSIFSLCTPYQIIDAEPSPSFMRIFATEKIAHLPSEISGSIAHCKEGLTVLYDKTFIKIPQMSYNEALEKRDLYFAKHVSAARIKDIVEAQFGLKNKRSSTFPDSQQLLIYPEWSESGENSGQCVGYSIRLG